MSVTHLAEKDPHGKDPHASGAKLDAGKIRPGLVLGGFARALWAVSEIGTFGANKYTENGWVEVPNGMARYDDAKMRHWLKEQMGQELDPDSEKTHLAHEAWNALARLDLHIRAQETAESNKVGVAPKQEPSGFSHDPLHTWLSPAVRSRVTDGYNPIRKP
jgi:hypothetical protein